MSQQQNTVINGPSGDVSQSPQDTPKIIPTGNENAQFSTNGSFTRPPLVRLDSRTGLPPRLGYPNQQGAQFRPPQPRPPFTGAPPFGPRPPLQRTPSSGQFNVAQNQPPRQGSPNPAPGLRPATPFPRTPLQSSPRPSGVYQQRSFPSPVPPKSSIPEQVPRSQTLDSSDLNSIRNVENSALPASANEEETPSVTAMKSKSPADAVGADNRRISLSSTGSNEEIRSVEEVPSRPESRAYMNRIVEDDVDPSKKDVYKTRTESVSNMYDNRAIPDVNTPKKDMYKSKNESGSDMYENRTIPDINTPKKDVYKSRNESVSDMYENRTAADINTPKKDAYKSRNESVSDMYENRTISDINTPKKDAYKSRNESVSDMYENRTIPDINTPKKDAYKSRNESVSDMYENRTIPDTNPPRKDVYKTRTESVSDIYENRAIPDIQNIAKPKSPAPEVKSPKAVDKTRSELLKTDTVNRGPSPDQVKIQAEKPRLPPSDNKLNLNLDDNRPKSPRTVPKVGDSPRSPVPTQKKVVPEKPKTLRPERSVDYKNGLLKSPTKSEGDNDSGVDESTQGNDQSSNGDQSSPRKPSGKLPTRSAASPTKTRSISRGSKSPNPLTPDSPTPSTPGTAEKKKVPMNKVQVGSAPSPNLKVVKSKVGSLQNTSYKPGGGNVKIENKKINIHAQPKIAAKNQTYVPGGGERKIEQRKLQWNASSKIGSLDNAHHKPKGSEKKIESIKLDFKDKAKPKVGSKDNIKHVPGGGDVKIETKKIDLKAKSKIGSLDNVKYKPGGGDKKIFDDKEYLRQKSGLSGENNSLNGSQPTYEEVKEYYSPEVNIISPTQERVRIIENVADVLPPQSRPSSRLSRSGSLRNKKSATPRTPWRL